MKMATWCVSKYVIINYIIYVESHKFILKPEDNVNAMESKFDIRLTVHN